MKLKRGLSIFLSLAMLIGILPMAASADGLLVGTEKGKISFVYMNYIDGVTDDSAGKKAESPIVIERAPQGTGADGAWQTGDTFFVGLKASKFEQIVAARDKGVNILCLGVKYNPLYVEPVDTVSDLVSNMGKRMGNLAEGDAMDPLSGSESTYAYSDASMKADKPVATDAVLNKAFTILLTDNTKTSYRGGKDAYAATIKFRFKDAAVPTGTPLFGIVPGEDTAISFDQGGKGGAYRYLDVDSPMESIIEFDASTLNLFPAPMSLDSVAVASGAPSLGSASSKLYEGAELDLSNVMLTPTYTDGTSTEERADVAATGFKYAGTSFADATEVTGKKLKLTTAMDGQPLYAYYTDDKGNTASVEVGTLNVQADAVATFTVNPGAISAKAGTTLAEAMASTKVTYTYGSGKTEEVAFKDFATKGITMTLEGATVDGTYVLKDTDNDKKLTVSDGAKSQDVTIAIVTKPTATAPETPVANVDKTDNSVKVTLPADVDELEYYIVPKDGTVPADAVWTPGKGFKGKFTALADGTALAPGSEYEVYARRLGNDEMDPSPAVKSAPVKLFMYKVTLVNGKSGAVLSVGYTDKATVTDQADLETIVTRPNKFNGYYSDADLKTSLDYATLDITTNPTVYVALKSGTGSPLGGNTGGSTTPTKTTIKFGESEITAKVGDAPRTVAATVSGTTSKPTYTSSDEKVVTVDEDGKLTFVSEGEATITATVAGEKATLKVTVTSAAEATPTPTPTATPDVTPAPTDPVINTKYAKAYITGYEDGTFRAENSITRAEVAAIFARLSSTPMDTSRDYAVSYSDVESNAWYKNYIGFLTTTGVLTGYEDGTFKPNNIITRAEMCAVITRAMGYTLSSDGTTFTDVAVDAPWAVNYVGTLAKEGVVTGYSDGTFGAAKGITRAETVTMINRLLMDGELVTNNTPNDVSSSYWAYTDIIKAMNDKKIEE